MNDIETAVMNKKGFLGRIQGEPFFVTAQEGYRLTNHGSEPVIFMQATGKEGVIAIHNAFVLHDGLSDLMNDRMIAMASGNRYNSSGVLELFRAAADGGREQYDMALLEGLVFLARLKNAGAVSKETAMPVDLENPRLLNAFVHAGKIIITEHGSAFLRPKNQ